MQRISNSINNSRSGLRQNTFILNTDDILYLDEKKGGSLIFLDCSVNNLEINLPPVNGSRGIFFNFVIENIVNEGTISFYAYDETGTAETKIKIKQHTDSDAVDNYIISIDTSTRNWIGENFQIVSDGEFWFITNLSYNETFVTLLNSGLSVKEDSNTDGNILTATGTGIVIGESNLTFDGNELVVKGDIVLRNDLTNTNNVVAFKDNNIVLSDNIDGCDIKTSNILNDYWIQCGIDINGSDNNDKSGYSVALSPNGKFLVVGSPFHDSNKGVTRVYKFELGNWSQIGNDIDGEAAGDKLGFSVNINNDGEIVAIGAPENDGTASNAGHVRVYKWDSSQWNLLDADIDGKAEDDKSGYSVSLNYKGDIVAIGAPENDGTASNAGHVRVYQYTTNVNSEGVSSNTWEKLGKDIEGVAEGDKSGSIVSLNSRGDIVAIGSPNYDSDRGHTRVFRWNETEWLQMGSDIDGENEDDLFGTSLNLSANGLTLAVGSAGINPGYIKIFYYNNDSLTWSQIGSNLESEQTMSLSLSGTGRYLGIGLPTSGNVKLYYWNKYFWKVIGSNIEAESTGDKFGFSISLSGDGHMFAVGAPENEDAGTLNGSTRVFTRTDVLKNIVTESEKNLKISTGVEIEAPSYTINFLEIGDAVYEIKSATDDIEIDFSNAINVGQHGFITFKFGGTVPNNFTFKTGVGWHFTLTGPGNDTPNILKLPNNVNTYYYSIFEKSKVMLTYRENIAVTA